MALALWVMAFAVAASHGCLSFPAHDPSVIHAQVSADSHDRSHQLHATGCLQFCEDSASAPQLSPSPTSPDPILWTLLLILPAVLLPAIISARFSALALHLPAPPRPPARLSFVRFND